MRINQYLARASGFSRRKADELIGTGQVKINGRPAAIGQSIKPGDQISLNDNILDLPTLQTIMLNKPAGYICSRQGQGSKTIYDLLAADLSHLKPAGRLDKDSSGLLILTNDGYLANRLTHPSYSKLKIYEVTLDKKLALADRNHLLKGVSLSDGLSKFESLAEAGSSSYKIGIKEGRNRQIRRTLQKLGYSVRKLNRLQFGPYKLGGLMPGRYKHL